MALFGQGFLDLISNWNAIRKLDRPQPSDPTVAVRSPWWIWVVRIYVLAILLAAPFRNGFSDWESQLLLLYVFLPVLPILPLVSWMIWRKNSSFRIPLLSLLLFGLAGIAFLQTLPIFRLDSWASPASIRIQAWFLGEDSDPGMGFFTNAMTQSLEQPREPGPLFANNQGSLCISHCPEWTRCALVGFCLAGILIWTSATAFNDILSQRILLGTLMLMGLLMSVLCFAESVAWQLPDWLIGENKQRLVGTFRNKNTAGSFLSVCLSAAVGITMESIRRLHQAKGRRDRRYRIDTVNPWASRLKNTVDFLSGLETIHIVWIVAIIFIFAATIATQSRGAALSSAAAVCFLFFLMSQQKLGTVGLSLVGMSVLAASVGLIVVLDIEVADRFENLLEGETLNDRGRLFVWFNSIKAGIYYVVTGSGLGTYGYAMLPFLEGHSGGWHRYAECLWGHLLVEFGVFGVIATLLALYEIGRIFRLAIRSAKSSNNFLVLYACSFCAIYTLIHGLVDFRLIVPGVFLPTCVLMGTLYGMALTRKIKHAEAIQPPKPERTVETPELEPASPEAELLKAVQVVRQKKVKHQSKRSRDPSSGRSKFKDSYAGLYGGGIIAWGGILLLLALLNSSIAPMRRAVETEYFEKWVREFASHVQNSPSHQEALQSIATDGYARTVTTSEWKRSQANLELMTWRLAYRDQAKSLGGNLEWSATGPFATRLATFHPLPTVEEEIKRLGGESFFDPWKGVGRLFAESHRMAPLDWRSQFGRILWNEEQSDSQRIATLRRWVPLALGRPSELSEGGFLAEILGDRELANECFAKSVELTPNIGLDVAFFMFPRLETDRLDPRILPKNVDLLKQIMTSEWFRKISASPDWKDNASEFDRFVENFALQSSRTVRSRYFLLTTLALKKGENEKAREYVEEWLARFEKDGEAISLKKKLLDDSGADHSR